MLKHDYFNNNASRLFISFAPNAAEGKYLFYAVRENTLSDCLFFNDLTDSYYYDDYHSVVDIVNQVCADKIYEEIILTGFSAGALTACLVASQINFNGIINVYSFSPYITLATEPSNAQIRLKGKDLSGFDLRKISDKKEKLRISIYLSVTSVRDGVHVRDSFSLTNKNVRSYYLRTDHATDLIVRENYPEGLVSLISGKFSVPLKYLADSDEIVKCLMMVDMGISEFQERISKYARVASITTNYSSEYSYWQSRQLARIGDVDEAIRWGWAAIIKSGAHAPASYIETLGNIAYDNGRPKEALQAYLQITNPRQSVLNRIELLQGWVSH